MNIINRKHILILLLMMVAICTISAASAADDSADGLAVEVADDSIELSDEVDLSDEGQDVISSADEDVLSKENITLDVNIKDKYVNDSDELYYESINILNFPDDAEGKVDLYFNDTLVASEDAIVFYGFDFDNLEIPGYGTIAWKIDYSGDDNYNPASANGTFLFSPYIKKDPGLTVDVPSRVVTFSYDGVEEYNAEINCQADGDFKFYVDDKLIGSDSSWEEFDLTNLGLTIGKHTWKAVYEEDAHYLPATVNGTFIYSDIYMSVLSVYYQDGYSRISFAAERQIGYFKVLIDGVQKFYKAFKLEEDFDEAMYMDLPEDLSYGQHTWKIIYEKTKGTTYYSESGTFEYSYPYELEYDSDVVYGHETTVKISLPDDFTGEIELSTANKTFKSKATQYNEIILSGLDLGKNVVNVNINSTNKNYPSKKDSFTISTEARISVPSVVDFDEEYVVELILPSNATGKLKVTVDVDDERFVDIVNGKASVNLGILNLSHEYGIDAIYIGDDYYVPTESSTVQVIPKISCPTEMICGEKKYFVFEAPATADGELQVSIDYEDYPSTLNNGKATIDLSELGAGSYSIYVEYSGDSVISAYSCSFSLEVKKIRANITYSIPSVIVANNVAKFVFNAPKDFDGSVDMEIYAGSEYIGWFTEEFTNGKAVVEVWTDFVGNHVAYFSTSDYGDKYESFDGSIRFEAVSPGSIKANDLTMLYSSNAPYKVQIFDKDGNPVKSGVKVIFELPTTSIVKYTDNNGYASCNIPNIAPGKYSIYTHANGMTKKKVLTVKQIVTLKTVTVKKSAKKLVLTVTLSKVNKKYLSKKQVTIKFNGKSYKVKTNSKGVAKVTIKSKVLKKLKVGKKVTYSASYGKATVKKTAKVKK